MVGLLGYDELELIMQILADRDNVREEVRAMYPNSFSLSLQSCSSTFSESPTILTTLSFMTYPNVCQVQVIFHVYSINSSLETLEETFSENNIRRRMQDQLKAHAARPLFSGSSVSFVTSAAAFL